MRIREPRTTALMFSSGKMVYTGARRYEELSLHPYQRNNLVLKQGSIELMC